MSLETEAYRIQGTDVFYPTFMIVMDFQQEFHVVIIDGEAEVKRVLNLN